MALHRGLVGPAGLVPGDFARAAEIELDVIAARLADPTRSARSSATATCPSSAACPAVAATTIPPGRDPDRIRRGYLMPSPPILGADIELGNAWTGNAYRTNLDAASRVVRKVDPDPRLRAVTRAATVTPPGTANGDGTG